MTKKILILSIILTGCGSAPTPGGAAPVVSAAGITVQKQECATITGPTTLYFHGPDNSGGNLMAYNYLATQADSGNYHLLGSGDAIELYKNKDHTYDVSVKITEQIANDIMSQPNAYFRICGIELSAISIHSGSSEFSVASARFFNNHGWINF